MPPTREPDEIQARKGNPSKRSLNREDKPTTEYIDKSAPLPPAPPMIANNPRAVEIWESVGPVLQTLGVFGTSDIAVVTRYCFTLAMLERAAADLESTGYEMKYETGARQISPALSAYTKLSDQAFKIERELGLTPAARSKVTTWGGNRPPARATDDAEPDGAPDREPANDESTPSTFKLTGS